MAVLGVGVPRKRKRKTVAFGELLAVWERHVVLYFGKR